MSCLQVELQETPYRRLTAKLQFPEDYPSAPLAVHLQSPSLSPGLLDKLAASATAAAAAHRGSPQAAYATDLLSKFVTANRLAPAFDDLTRLREYFSAVSTASPDAVPASTATSAPPTADADAVEFTVKHAKQACGEVAITLRAGEYYMHVRAVVPHGYPAEPLALDVTDSNLPPQLLRGEITDAVDMAARLAEFKAPQTDVLAAGARQGAGAAATSRTEQLAREGKQTVTSFNKGQVRRFLWGVSVRRAGVPVLGVRGHCTVAAWRPRWRGCTGASRLHAVHPLIVCSVRR